ncbi:MAG TPA: hypothetical protein DCK76_02195 [Desulfotomaculum sp.]|nr:MAG: Phosphatidylethanolamine-binding protein [Desulfotomaculum sp. 46_80]HAG10209.1 hypothetical protein [Desulfotomaculum sp.]HBY04257.1 hypothetical protein [Desulfotomaculum sp.]
MFTLKSSAFANGGAIPEKYTEMNIVSPPLNWEDIPKGTKSFTKINPLLGHTIKRFISFAKKNLSEIEIPRVSLREFLKIGSLRVLFLRINGDHKK